MLRAPLTTPTGKDVTHVWLRRRQHNPTLVKFHFMALGEKKKTSETQKPSLLQPGPPCHGASRFPQPPPRTHLPRVPLPLGCSFIHFHRGWASSPLTSILLNMSNFTP